MNVSITSQSFMSHVRMNRRKAGSMIRRIIGILKKMHSRARKVDYKILSTNGARWLLSRALAGPNTPRHGYAMCHALELAVSLRVFGEQYVPAYWEPVAYGGGTCKALEHLTGVNVGTLMRSPALVRILLEVVRCALSTKRGLAFVKTLDLSLIHI